MKKTILPLIVALGLVSFGASAQAQTENVDFSMSSLSLLADSYSPHSNSNIAVTGTLTGELFGLTVGSSNTTPTSIEVTSLPYPSNAPALTISTPLTFVPVTTSDDSSPASSGSFSVNADGTINSSSSKYQALYQSTTNPSEDLLLDFNYEGLFDGAIVTYNADGGYGASPTSASDTIESLGDGSGVTYTIAATPEPSAWALGVTAIALFGVLRRRALSA